MRESRNFLEINFNILFAFGIFLDSSSGSKSGIRHVYHANWTTVTRTFLFTDYKPANHAVTASVSCSRGEVGKDTDREKSVFLPSDPMREGKCTSNLNQQQRQGVHRVKHGRLALLAFWTNIFTHREGSGVTTNTPRTRFRTNTPVHSDRK